MSDKKKSAYVISSYGYIDKHINYGALLQYYALEKTLSKLGVRTKWIRYSPKEIIWNKQSIKGIIKNIIFYRNQNKLKNVRKKFKIFLEKYCNLTDKIYTKYDELNYCNDADLYITGSDQVWGGCAKENYLCFVPDDKIKISYAASFGRAEISQEQKDIIKPWLKRLDYISVREKSGVKICDDIGIRAEWVLDPTLLIDRNEYPVNLDKTDISRVYCYFLNITSKEDIYWNDIIQFIETDNLLIKVACVENTVRLFPQNYITIDSVEGWLSNYSNSKYILTNTFHGMIFAIIFHKQFLVLKQSGLGEKQNDRMVSILNLLELEERFYDEKFPIKDQINKKIDWDKIDNILNKERQKSIDFIKKTLSDI